MNRIVRSASPAGNRSGFDSAFRIGKKFLAARFLLLLSVSFFVYGTTHAAEITLAWDPVDGAAGYKIYYGTVSGAYTTVVDVGKTTTRSLTLADGHIYYLAATAYDAAKLESGFSGEISYRAGAPICSYSLSSESATLPAAGGSGRISVTTQSGCSWTASTGVSWITIASGVSGTGTGAVNYIVAANTGPSRTAAWTIAGRTFTSIQSGTTGQSLVIQKSGSGSGKVSSLPSAIDCGSSCEASFKKGTRVTIVPAPETGSVFAGWTGDCSGARECSLVMNVDRTVGATFEAGSCAYRVSPAGKTLSHRGGVVSARVTAKDHAYCAAPETLGDADWITPAATAFTRNHGSVKLVIAKNESSEGRSATISIGGNTFTVNQKGAPCSISLGPPSFSDVPGTGGGGSFNVMTAPGDCAWKAEAVGNSAWIHAAGANGAVDYTVDENTGRGTRTGRISVTLIANKHGKFFTVRQGSQ